MRLVFQNTEQNEIARLIATDLERHLKRLRHIHGGDTVTFDTISAATLTTIEGRLNIRPSCQFSLHLMEEDREKYIPRAGGNAFHILLFQHEDGRLVCSLRSKNIGADQRYQGTTDNPAEFAENVALAIKLFLQYND